MGFNLRELTYTQSSGFRRKAERCTNSMECSAVRMQRDSQNSTPTFHLKVCTECLASQALQQKIFLVAIYIAFRGNKNKNGQQKFYQQLNNGHCMQCR